LESANISPEGLAQFLQHSIARKYAQVLPENGKKKDTVWANMTKFCGELPARSQFKSTFIHQVYDGVATTDVPAAACTGRELKRSRTTLQGPKIASTKKILSSMRVYGERTRVHATVFQSCVDHLYKQSFVTSGSATTTRCIALSKEQLYTKWRGKYSDILHAIHKSNPEYLHGTTILCKDIRKVLSGQHNTPRWCKERKKRDRTKLARKKREFGPLKVAPGTVVVDCQDSEHPQFTFHKAMSDDGDDPLGDSSSSSDPVSDLEAASMTNTITPLSYRVYWRCIRLYRDADNQGLRFKKIKKVHGCSICLTADTTTRNYAKCNSALAQAEDTKHGNAMGIMQARKKLEEAYKQFENLCRHQEQYKTQRAYLQQREQLLANKSIDMFQIIVYEDFVAMYNLLGRKVQDLVFTIVWRDENGVLCRKYIDNYCTDATRSADADYVVNSWRMHLVINRMLKEHEDAEDEEEKTRLKSLINNHRESAFPSEFEGVTHVLRSGDSGSHFHNRLVFDWESEVHSMYGIIWETHNLCKRHAWNLCDSHGAQAKKGAHAAAMAGMAPETAIEFATIINECRTGYGQAKAYVMERINRNTKQERMRKLKEMPGVKKCSEFQYWYYSAEKTVLRTPGVIRMRQCSQDASNPEDYITIDLRKRPTSWGKICKKCTHTLQRPVHHKRSGDKCGLAVRNMICESTFNTRH
jgi:hypothetical protein